MFKPPRQRQIFMGLKVDVRGSELLQYTIK